jgi:outer membrane protein insertion porin family
VKSSIKYTLSHDRRDNTMTPSQGHYLSWMTEAAGLGGDAKYLKSEATAQYYYPLSSSFV